MEKKGKFKKEIPVASHGITSRLPNGNLMQRRRSCQYLESLNSWNRRSIYLVNHHPLESTNYKVVSSQDVCLLESLKLFKKPETVCLSAQHFLCSNSL